MRDSKFISVIAACLATATLTSSCSSNEHQSKQPAHARTWSVALEEVDLQAQTVVAKVNGRPILDTCVTTQALGHGLSPRAALAECIDFELLAQAALSAGMEKQPKVQKAAKTALVRSFLNARYPVHTPEDIPDKLVKKLWEQTKVPRYIRPELRDIVFCRIPPTKNKDPRNTEDATAKRFLQDIYEQLKDRKALAKNDLFAPCYNKYKDAGIEKLTLNLFRLTPKSEYQEAFQGSVFGEEGQGQVVPPLHTQYGWDLILITAVVPEISSALEDNEKELRTALFTLPVFEHSRDAIFEEWFSPLAKKHNVTITPKALENSATTSAMPSWPIPSSGTSR